jgi:quercetin dioxygenase-like cupin family protein
VSVEWLRGKPFRLGGRNRRRSGVSTRPDAGKLPFRNLGSARNGYAGGQFGQDGLSILEHRAPYGDSPQLHIHRTEDEVFHILEGEFRLKINEPEQRLGPGEILLTAKGVPHTYHVESPEGGRWLTITVRGDFERFVRAMARPAERLVLPEPAGAPSAEAIQPLTATAAQYGIEIVGPPLH